MALTKRIKLKKNCRFYHLLAYTIKYALLNLDVLTALGSLVFYIFSLLYIIFMQIQIDTNICDSLKTKRIKRKA